MGAFENRQRKLEAGKGEVAPGVTVGSLRHFRTALRETTQRLPKQRRLHEQRSENLERTVLL